MNVSFSHHLYSRAIGRIELNLRKYSPINLNWTEYEDADLIIFPVTGRHDHIVSQTNLLKKLGKKYTIIQLSLKSTRNPNASDWLDLWKDARIVWSYYKLPEKFNFYHAPLGADSSIFYRTGVERSYIVGTTGNYPRAECLWEIGEATRQTYTQNLTIKAADDKELNNQYNQCSFISGLRRKEGFEMPAIEGILAGARPIVFDTPDFHYWYDNIAKFIPENIPAMVINNLANLFKYKPAPINNKDIIETKNRFNWETIIKGFWERCLI